MYAFFFISGVTWKSAKIRNQTVNEFVNKGFKSLFVPYLVFAFLWDLTNWIISVYTVGFNEISISWIVTNIVNVCLVGGFNNINSIIGPAWFLSCLLVSRIIYYILTRITSTIDISFIGVV